MKSKKQYTPEFKSEVVIEAISGKSTLSELSIKYELSENQISKWKDELLSKASKVFENNAEEEIANFSELIYLNNKIDKLKEECDSLEKVNLKLGKVNFNLENSNLKLSAEESDLIKKLDNLDS